MAQREQDLALEMRTLASAAEAAWWCLRMPEVIDYAQRAVELTQQVDDPRSEVLARLFLYRALAGIGDVEAARPNKAILELRLKTPVLTRWAQGQPAN